MEIKDIIAERVLLLSKSDNNKDLQNIEIELCKRNILYFFKNYLYTDKNDTFFSKNTPQEVPFIPFPFQEEFILEVWESIIEASKPVNERKQGVLTDVFIEKSRQMGISWLMCGIFLYGFIFHHHKYTIISRTAGEVDTPGDMDSMFEKIRFMIKNLPQWILPIGFSKTSGNITNKYMSISDINTSASITGKTANPDAGRGGTRNAIFMDEMAFMQYANQINKSAGNNTSCRIFNSTPNGQGNEFYRMRELSIKGEIKRLRYHWTEHSLYNKDWYNSKILGKTREAIAQELEIDYNVSVMGRVYKEYKGILERIDYRPLQPLFIAIDNSHGGKDPHAIIVCQNDNITGFWYIIDSMEFECSVDAMAEILSGVCKISLSDAQEEFFNRYKTYNSQKAIFIADPYDTHTTLNNSTIFDIYKKQGIYLNTPVNRDKLSQIQLTKSNISKYKISDKCVDFNAAILNARYPEEKENTNSTTAKVNPVHNWTSHFRTALEYLTVFLLEQEGKQTRKKQLNENRPMRDYRTGELIYKNNLQLAK